MMNTSDSSSPSSCCSGSPSCTAALVLGIIALVLALIGFFPVPGLDYSDSCGAACHYCTDHEHCGCQ